MDWEAIGAVGELVGAVAVVMTLGYLAVQVRYARRATSDTNRLTRAVGIRELLGRLVDDDRLRHAWIRTEGSTEMYQRLADALGVEPEEAGLVEFQCQCWFWVHWGHWAGMTGERDRHELRNVISGFYSVPPMSTVWKLSPNVGLLDPDFQKFVNSSLASK